MVSLPVGICALILSSGSEADEMGAILAKAILAHSYDISVQACSLRGRGAKYCKSGVPLIETQSKILDGCLTFWRRSRSLKLMRWRFNLVIAIGGIWSLFIACKYMCNPLVFIPTIRIDAWRNWRRVRHMLQSCDLVLPQDDATAAARLRQVGVPAVYLGNLRTDCLQINRSFELSLRRVVGILPGSCSEAYRNIAGLAQLVLCLYGLVPDLDFFVSISSKLKFSKFVDVLQPRGWIIGEIEPDELADGIVGKLTYGECILRFVSGRRGDLIHISELCLSADPLVGEQVCGMGKPVVVLTEENGIKRILPKGNSFLHDSVVITKSEAKAAAQIAARILVDNDLYHKLSLAGKVKVGGRGVASRIAEKVSEVVREYHLRRRRDLW